MRNQPQLAILGENALEALGLQSLLEKIIPIARVSIFAGFDELSHSDLCFFHYFISSSVVQEHVEFFKERVRQTIVLANGPTDEVPSFFRSVNIQIPLQGLLKQFMEMGHLAAFHQDKFPTEMLHEMSAPKRSDNLTPREIEVLQYVAKGYTSKEIADMCHISLSTVLTHRKNVMEKVGAHSATKLVIYAVLQGYVSPEDISD